MSAPSRPLRLAIASGKGGTGKTTLATNLATVLAESGLATAYVDCDVEEPNGHLFLSPDLTSSRDVCVRVPEVDAAKCTLCGACGRACRHSAILALPKKVLTFPKLCHSCGGCTLACPSGALREVDRPIGKVEEGTASALGFVHGRLSVGEAMAPPAIRAVLAAAPADRTLVIDAPPGTSCPVIATVRSADAVLLVTEPTPFGLNDLRLAVEMVRELGRPFGVAVNRVGAGDDAVFDYCAAEGIPVLLRLPQDRRLAEAYSRGELAVRALPELRPAFTSLFQELQRLAATTVAPRPRAVAPACPETPATPPPSEPAARVGDLVVVSGKGGTGKTSVVAAFASLARRVALADCDVDAADLHLVLGPTVRHRWPFSGGRTAQAAPERCDGCGACVDLCRYQALRVAPTTGRVEVSEVGCEGCGVCVDHCPKGALALVPAQNGEWMVSDTRHGPLVHARLGVAQENSGKLVTLVRREARALAGAQDRPLLLCDGSPGIGCPVISSLTGARLALVVTEPTVSGLHDLRRVVELARQLGTPCAVCVNKADLNPDVAAQIEREAAGLGASPLGRIRYDEAISVAQVRGLSVIEHGHGPAAADLRGLWEQVKATLRAPRQPAPPTPNQRPQETRQP